MSACLTKIRSDGESALSDASEHLGGGSCHVPGLVEVRENDLEESHEAFGSDRRWVPTLHAVKLAAVPLDSSAGEEDPQRKGQ